jgi:DNA modification methylase
MPRAEAYAPVSPVPARLGPAGLPGAWRDATPAGELRLGDALHVARALPDGCVDLVYVDPPFATGRRRSGRAGLGFDDGDAVVAALGPRLVEIHRLLAATGSLVVHLDYRAVHAVKVALDGIFGPARFRNEIIWRYGSGGRAERHFSRKHDSLLWYSRSDRYGFDGDAVARPRSTCPACGETRARWNHLKVETDPDGRRFRTVRSAGRLYRYYDDDRVPPDDVWLDLPHLQQRDPERCGWPTQKPEALLARVIAALSRPGDRVADLCCGSGTTLVAAARLGRRWLGADLSRDALALAATRLVAVTGGPVPVVSHGLVPAAAGGPALADLLALAAPGPGPGIGRLETPHGAVPVLGPYPELTAAALDAVAGSLRAHGEPAALVVAPPPDPGLLPALVRLATDEAPLLLGWLHPAGDAPDDRLLIPSPEVAPLAVATLAPGVLRVVLPAARSLAPTGRVVRATLWHRSAGAPARPLGEVTPGVDGRGEWVVVLPEGSGRLCAVIEDEGGRVALSR